MRIISKVRDYYDGLQEEDGNIFIREEKPVSDKDQDYLVKLYNHIPSVSTILGYTVGKALILFCGNAYPIYYARKNDYLTYVSPKNKTYCTQFPSEYEGILRDKLKVPKEDMPHIRRYCYFGESEFSDKGIHNFNIHLKTQSKRLMEVFYSTKSPIVVVYKPDIHIRGALDIKTAVPLLNFGFQAIIPPFEAYQMLTHFVTNDLVYDPLANFKMSDELKRDSKGFDKYSFKKGKANV